MNVKKFRALDINFLVTSAPLKCYLLSLFLICKKIIGPNHTEVEILYEGLGTYSLVVNKTDGITLPKVNNVNIRIIYKICSKLTLKTPEPRQRRRTDVFIINFE